MKRETLADVVGRDMTFPADYRCKFCKKRIMHIFRGQHMLTHTDKLFEYCYTPMRNKK